MNILIEKGLVHELPCGTDFAYVLQDECAFLPTEYKVLQRQAGGGFLRCMKLLYNGKVQLYYLTEQQKTLEALLPVLDSEAFMVICSNLLTVILDVKSNGFLSCRNIDISFNRIYVDPTTYKVSLVYMPVGQRLFEDAMGFENELRSGLVKALQIHSHLSGIKIDRFAANLSNGSVSLESLYTSIKTGNMAAQPQFGSSYGQGYVQPQFYPQPQTFSQPAGQMKLVAVNAPGRVELVVNKAEFVIGKKADAVDGVVSFNKMISRVHCKITAVGGVYTITDLGSANGTYVNRMRLSPHVPSPLKHGDVVRMADSDFKVIVG